MAPTFVAKPTIRQDADGTTLIFHCSIMADPRPAISWFRNGVKVQDNEKFQVRFITCFRRMHTKECKSTFLKAIFRTNSNARRIKKLKV